MNTSVFIVDNIPPTAPGNLTVSSTAITSATLNFGVPAVDSSFRDYRIYYKIGSSGVTQDDNVFTTSSDSNLGFANYGGASSTILSGLAKSTTYVANIWVYDDYNNYSSAVSEVSFNTLADVPGIIISGNIGLNLLTLTWGGNGNGSDTQYYIEDINNTARTSGWISSNSFTFNSLLSNTYYTFHVKAKNLNGIETVYGESASFRTDSEGGASPPPPPPPPPPPAPPSPPPSSSPLVGSIVINSGDVETYWRNVQITVNVPGAVRMKFSDEPSFAGVFYQIYADSFLYNLRGSYGTKTIYGRFQSDDDRIAEASDSIVYREDAPNGNICGNGIVETGETCDDGNTVSSDGCSSVCSIENSGGNGGGEPGSGGGISITPSSSPTPTLGATSSQSIFSPSLPTTTTKPLPVAQILPPPASTTTIKKSIVERLPKMPTTMKEAKKNVENLSKQVATAVENAQETLNDPLVKDVVKKVVAPVSIGVTVIALAPSLAQGALSLAQYLFLQPLMFLGLRRKKAWGIVYDTLTKLPVDLALVRLVNAETKQIVQTQVTDQKGRYLFMAKAGKYILTVTKPNYQFPSKLLAHAVSDGRTADLYHGEKIVAPDDNFSLFANIPLDPYGMKDHIHRIGWDKFWRALQDGVAMGGIIATSVSLYINPSWQVGSFLVLHIALAAAFLRLAAKPIAPKRWGKIIDKKNKKMIGNAIIRLYAADLNKLVSVQVTDRQGRYAFLVGPNQYYITVEKEGYNPLKSNMFQPRDLKDGFIASNLELVPDQVVRKAAS